MKRNPYFVEYSEYAGFGQLTISREFFADWISMRRFVNNLRQGALLDFGEIRPSLAAEKRAA